MFEKLFTDRRIPHMLVILSLLIVLLSCIALFTSHVDKGVSVANTQNSLSVLYILIRDVFGTSLYARLIKLALFIIPSLIFINQIAKDIKLFNDMYSMTVWVAFTSLLFLCVNVDFGAIVPAFLFMTMASKALISSNQYENGAFNSGFYLGLASIIYLPAIVLFIAHLFGVLGLKAKKTIPSILLFLLGLILPVLFVEGYLYIFDIDFKTNIIEMVLSYISWDINCSISIAIYAGVIILITLFSAVVFRTSINEKTVWDRMVNSYFLIYAISLIVGGIIFPNLLIYFLILYIIPFSYFFTLLYIGLKKNIHRLLLVDGFVIYTLILVMVQKCWTNVV
ncbi:MAG: hypothetical protein ACK5L5_02815 [Bacteroidales bacterium]